MDALIEAWRKGRWQEMARGDQSVCEGVQGKVGAFLEKWLEKRGQGSQGALAAVDWGPGTGLGRGAAGDAMLRWGRLPAKCAGTVWQEAGTGCSLAVS